MEMLKRLEPVALFLIVCGALNWGIVGLFDTNVVAEIFGTGTASDVIYVLVGVSALMLMPRFLSEIRTGTHAHAH